jgi:type II secretory ATPase GspE/PulE/Tfp pilus assembly ATPase PilB-like protein
MAHLDIVESRVPQDGKIRFQQGELRLDLRISTFPTVLGESLVIRILDRARTTYALEHLGLDSVDVEVLCRRCSVEHQPDREEAAAHGVPAGESFFRSTGCDQCEGRGTRGRSAIFELLEISPELNALIIREASEKALRDQAIESGMRGFRMAALDKARAGLISLQEYARITSDG